jgi:nucleotide-binding universal stress UspA family protein
MADELSTKFGEGVTVLTAISETPLLRAINDTIREDEVDMVLLGSDNCQSSNNSFIAGNIISIAKISSVRVLVVPSDYVFRPVEDVLLPCDYRVLHNLAKLNDPKDAAMAKDIHLHVLNVDAKERYLNPTEEFKDMEAHLHHYLQNFRHDINYSNEKNIIDGIIKYTNVNDFQLIISLPGKHSFLYYLTNSSISEAICRNAKVPVMILK